MSITREKGASDQSVAASTMLLEHTNMSNVCYWSDEQYLIARRDTRVRLVIIVLAL